MEMEISMTEIADTAVALMVAQKAVDPATREVNDDLLSDAALALALDEHNGVLPEAEALAMQVALFVGVHVGPATAEVEAQKFLDLFAIQRMIVATASAD